MTYIDAGEHTREFYRKQGEERERLRILTLLEMLDNHHKNSSWSPTYIKDLIERKVESIERQS